MTRETISVVMGVYNEGYQIARALDALTWADEIVVVDRFSTDDTEAVATRYPNVRFLKRQEWLNPNVNFAMEQATGDWTLRLDADEVVSPELAAEIQTLLESPDARYTGYWAPNRTYFFGKWLRYGLAYDPQFASQPLYHSFRKILWRKGTAHYPCRATHEDILTEGEYGILRHPYDHFSHPSVSLWIAKMNFYTDQDMVRKDVLAPDFRLPSPHRTLVAIPKIFFESYVKRKGYRDGTIGFVACCLSVIYMVVERAKIWEKHYRLTHANEVVAYGRPSASTLYGPPAGSETDEERQEAHGSTQD